MIRGSIFSLLLFSFTTATAQDNSPYSRFGLGDVVPNTNISTRGLGGISAGYRDPLSVNFSNPASYSAFSAYLERTSKQVAAGRVVLDVGMNIDSRKLRQPNNPQTFTSTNAQFSYLQLGVPIKNNWGLSFGLRPVTRVGYKISRLEELINPFTGQVIDSAYTEFNGDGGSFLPSIGTGFAIKNLSIGANVGYLFGKKQMTTRRAFINDTLAYQQSNHTTQYSFGDLFFTAGLQYDIKLKEDSTSSTHLILGAAGNWSQDIKTSRDISRSTFVSNTDGQEFRIDSVFEQNDVRGSIVFPATFTYGFTINHTPNPNRERNRRPWMVGVDITNGQWSKFRIFGAADSVRDNMEVRAGIQLSPSWNGLINKGYGGKVTYRAGFFMGSDYIAVANSKGQVEKLPLMGFSLGFGLPISGMNRFSRNQVSNLNLALEYSRRGDNESRLKDNIFRVSASFNLADLWFAKRRYD
jgi:hypothetical protein